MRSALIVAVLALALAGCVPVAAIRTGVEGYCARSEVARVATREAVAEAIAPHRVEIHCSGDAR